MVTEQNMFSNDCVSDDVFNTRVALNADDAHDLLGKLSSKVERYYNAVNIIAPWITINDHVFRIWQNGQRMFLMKQHQIRIYY